MKLCNLTLGRNLTPDNIKKLIDHQPFDCNVNDEKDLRYINHLLLLLMAYSDKAVGFVLLSVSTFIFIYYSIWILLLVSK